MFFFDRFGDVPNFNVKKERDNWAGVSIVSSPKKQHLASWFLGDKHGITFPNWKGFKGWATQFPKISWVPNGVLFRGIQGLFGCLSTLLATDFGENDWPFDLYLLTDT